MQVNGIIGDINKKKNAAGERATKCGTPTAQHCIRTGSCPDFSTFFSLTYIHGNKYICGRIRLA